MDDCVAWHYDKKGIFSVKSAYKVQMEDNRRRSVRGVQGTSAGSSLQKDHWAGIWAMNCPGKIKHFIWRLAHNSLAVRMNLERRGLELDTRCVMCNRLNEDSAHLLFKCKFAKHLWRELGLEEKRQHLSELQNAEETIKVLLKMEKRDQIYVCVTLYQWWRERNNVREGERKKSPAEVAFIIQAEEFLKNPELPVRASREGVERWKRPVEDVLKINSDGSFNPKTGAGGWGAVIRNSMGQVVKAGAGHIHHALDAFHTEVIAALEGVKMAKMAGMTNVVLETDAILLKYALVNNSFRQSSVGGLIHEIKAIADACFSSFSCCHCNRGYNQVAHAFADIGCNGPRGTIQYWESPPIGVDVLVASDCAVSTV